MIDNIILWVIEVLIALSNTNQQLIIRLIIGINNNESIVKINQIHVESLYILHALQLRWEINVNCEYISIGGYHLRLIIKLTHMLKF